MAAPAGPSLRSRRHLGEAALMPLTSGVAAMRTESLLLAEGDPVELSNRCTDRCLIAS
jgi:hypothetical protein